MSSLEDVQSPQPPQLFNMEEKLLPVKNRTESFWLTERDPELKNARTTPNLPSSADVVIVGSGLAGAMMAYNLVRKAKAQGKHLNIVMLEADECCGSATARNGEFTIGVS